MPAVPTQLIDSDDFTNRAILSAYVDTERLTIAILQAQETFIKPILGETLYDELVDWFDTMTFPAAMFYNYQALYNKVVPYLVQRTYIIFQSSTGIQDTQSGVRINIDDYSQQLNGDQLAAFLRQHRTMAEVEYNALYKYLDDNKATFTSWDDGACRNHQGVSTFSAIGANDRQRGRWDGDRKAKDNRESEREYYENHTNRKRYRN